MNVERNGLDQLHVTLKRIVEPRDQFGIEFIVELRGLQAGFANVADNLLGVHRGEDADREHVAGKMRSDHGDLRGNDAPAAGREDETDRIGAQLGGELGVLEVRVGADLDEHRKSGWLVVSGLTFRMIIPCLSAVSVLRRAAPDASATRR